MKFLKRVAFFLTAKQVAEVSRYLQDLTKEEIWQLYDFPAMVKSQVYLTESISDGEEIFDYLYFNLMTLKDFYQQAADEDKAVIFYIM